MKTALTMSIGEKIRLFRIGAGLTQMELGHKCGVADSQIGAWERGESKPKDFSIEKVAKALGISAKELKGDN